MQFIYKANRVFMNICWLKNILKKLLSSIKIEKKKDKDKDRK
jgi:hypothetical protein